MNNFPSDYDYHQDPTYQLAVRHKATLVGIGKKGEKEKKKVPMDIVRLSLLEVEGSDILDEEESIKSIGSWNWFLQAHLYSTRESTNAVLRTFYPLVEAFARTGIYIQPITIQSGSDIKLTYIMIIPPFLALYWDDYYKEDVIGKKAMAVVNITPARNSIDVFASNPSKYVQKAMLDSLVIGTDDSHTLESEIKAIRDLFEKEVLKTPEDERLKSGYVAVFAYSMTAAAGAYDLEQTLFHITKMIYDPMRQKTEESLKPRKQDVKKVTDKNLAIVRKTESSFDEPLFVLFFEPVPIPSSGLRLKDRYARRSKDLPTMTNKSLKNLQECARGGTCDVDSQNASASGFILHGSNRLSKPTGNISVDVDCSPANLAVQAQEFGIQRKDGESTQELCSRVTQAIRSKMTRSRIA